MSAAEIQPRNAALAEATRAALAAYSRATGADGEVTGPEIVRAAATIPIGPPPSGPSR